MTTVALTNPGGLATAVANAAAASTGRGLTNCREGMRNAPLRSVLRSGASCSKGRVLHGTVHYIFGMITVSMT